MELLQDIQVIAEFSPLHKLILTIAIVLFFTVLVFWVALALNCIIGNIILARVDKKKERYEDLVLSIDKAADFPAIPPGDFPVFVNVVLQYKALLLDNEFIRELFTTTGVLRHYRRDIKSINWKKRLRAVRILGSIGGDDIYHWIKPLTNDKSVFVRDEALLALSKLDSQGAARYTLDYLSSRYDTDNIRWIDLVLQNIGKKYPMVFTQSLGTKNIHLKHKILDIIRYMHLSEYLPQVQEMVHNGGEDEESLVKCIFILSLFPTPHNRSILIAKLVEPGTTAEIRKYIALALYKIDPHLREGNPDRGEPA